MSHSLTICLLVLLHFGCQTTYVIQTDPSGATVVLNAQTMGETPLVLEKDTFSKETCFTDNQLCLVGIRLEGYAVEWVALSSETPSFELQIEMKSQEKSDHKQNNNLSTIELARLGVALEGAGSDLLEMQTRLFEGESIQPSDIAAMVDRHGESSGLRYLESMALFQSGKSEEAVEAIDRAISRAPGNLDYRVIKKQMTKEFQ